MEFRINHSVWKNSLKEWEKRKKFQEHQEKFNFIWTKKKLEFGKMRFWSSFFYKMFSTINKNNLSQKTFLQILKKIFQNSIKCSWNFQGKKFHQKNIVGASLLNNPLILHNRSFFKFKTSPYCFIFELFYNSLCQNKIGTIIDNLILCPSCKKIEIQREVWNLSVTFILERDEKSTLQNAVKISPGYFCKNCFYKVFSYQKSFFQSLPLLAYRRTFCFFSFKNLLITEFYQSSYFFLNFEKWINFSQFNKSNAMYVILSFSIVRCLYYLFFLKSKYSKKRNFFKKKSILPNRPKIFNYIHDKNNGSIFLKQNFKNKKNKKFTETLNSQEKIQKSKLAYFYFFKLQKNRLKNLKKNFLGYNARN